jgi:hypothetical protein
LRRELGSSPLKRPPSSSEKLGLKPTLRREDPMTPYLGFFCRFFVQEATPTHQTPGCPITPSWVSFLPKAYHLLLRRFERQTFLLHTTLFSEFSLPVPILILIDGFTLVCSTLGLVGFYAKDNYYCFCHTLYELYLLLASNPKQLALPRFHPCKQESSPRCFSQGIFPK